MTTTTRPTPAQTKALIAAIADNGELAFHLNGRTRLAILRNGWATRDDNTQMGTITDAGRDAARLADPEAYASALPADQVQAELDCVAPKFPAGTPEHTAYASELRTELDKFAHGEPLAADAPAETPAPTSYVVHFARIGRNLDAAPLVTGPVDSPARLAELVQRYARPHIASRFVEVAVDLAARTGCILAGVRNAGTFTIADPDQAVPFVHSDLGAMPGYVAGWCGHRVAGSEWRAGFRVCEHCPDPRAVNNRSDEQPDGSPCACGQEGCSVCDFI